MSEEDKNDRKRDSAAPAAGRESAESSPPEPPVPSTGEVGPRRDSRFGVLALFLSAVVSASVAAAGGYVLGSHKHGAAETASKVQYQCPMHPTIVQDHPGECPICGMKLVRVGGPIDPKDRKIKFYRSPMDPKQTSPTPRKDEMGMDYIPVYEDELDGSGSKVEGLATVTIDPARQQLIGLKTAEVTRGKIGGGWRTFSRVAVDERKVRHISIKVPVFVENVYVNFVGKKVRKGEALFSGYSPDLLAAQAEYRIALSTQSTLAASTGGPLAGNELVKAARRKLELLDLPEGAIKKLDQGGEAMRTIGFGSPIEGVVTKKDVVDGMKLDAGAMPYEIVDLSSVWVLADIYESDIHRVRIGMSAKLNLKAYPNRTFDGTAAFIDPMLDPVTRTAKLRLEFPNPGGELKPGMFGETTLESTAHEGLRIPEDAVIDSGTRKVVFVSLGEGKLQPREVLLGESDRSTVEVISGLTEGEKVVVRANFLVDSESQLRASLAALSETKPRPSPSASTSSSTSAAPTSSAPPSSSAPGHVHGSTMFVPSPGVAPSASTSASVAAVYACPMHPEVTDSKPSKCPKCGMTLQRKDK